MHQRRSLSWTLGATVSLTLAGCMTPPPQPVNADGRYCHRIGKRYQPSVTCTPTAVPSASADAEAKRFDADPAALTVYVLRRRWADASAVVPVSVDGAATVSTIPASLVRLRLPPGVHQLSAQWAGQALATEVQGRAGELRVVELVGSAWSWGTRFAWEAAQGEAVKTRAQTARLVADLDLRP